jgi:hypothetical protein
MRIGHARWGRERLKRTPHDEIIQKRVFREQMGAYGWTESISGYTLCRIRHRRKISSPIGVPQ